MKISLFALALFSTAVFAIGTNELTGSFEDSKQVTAREGDDQFYTGSSSFEVVEKTRVPASVEGKRQNISHVTELTGTFE